MTDRAASANGYWGRPGLEQRILDALAATSDFDNTYRAQQGIVVEEGVRLHGNFARSGNSPTLRPIAENAENVMRANLQALRGSR